MRLTRFTSWLSVVVLLLALTGTAVAAIVVTASSSSSPTKFVALAGLAVTTLGALAAYANAWRLRLDRQAINRGMAEIEIEHLRYQLTLLAGAGSARVGRFDYPSIKRTLSAEAEVDPRFRKSLVRLAAQLSAVEVALARSIAQPEAILMRAELRHLARVTLAELPAPRREGSWWSRWRSAKDG